MIDSSSTATNVGVRHRSPMTPLWVISLFVSLCEVVAGLAVTQADGGVQVALTSFVIGFPLLVAIGFFSILWNRPYVFYPPTEFGSTTGVSEYVSALAGLPSPEAGAQQRKLLGQSQETEPQAGDPSSETLDPDIAELRAELANDVLKYFAFRRLRYSDVSSGAARGIFNLGAPHGFLLFDGMQEIVFFGFFTEIDETEVVARTRFLFNAIDRGYQQLKQHQDESQRNAALALLDRIQIELLVEEEALVKSLAAKIEEYRPTGTAVSVAIRRPSEVQAEVELEYTRMSVTATEPARRRSVEATDRQG